MSNKNQQTTLFEESVGRVETDRCKRVLVPFPVDKAYDYIVPDDMDAQSGDYVSVPLSGRNVNGVVWGDAEGAVNPKKLKSIVWRHDFPSMPSVQRKFIDWVSDYTLAAKGSVLKMSLSAPTAMDPPKPIKAYKIKSSGGKLSAARQKVMDVLSDGYPRRASEIAELASVSAGVVKGMADKGLLELVEIYSAAPCRNPDITREGPELSSDQRAAADQLSEQVMSGGYQASLVDGVTGAGKTEVYFEAVAQALKSGKQALILLPEIALSNAFLERFKSRFGCAPALWHSHLTPAQRRKTWRGVAMGETKVVVGARSALFLPYQDLGFLVVDEEHDPAYKQEDGGVIYHARDMAIVRAHLGKIPIALVSATPSLETMHNAWNGRYMHLHLPDRFGGARLPGWAKDPDFPAVDVVENEKNFKVKAELAGMKPEDVEISVTDGFLTIKGEKQEETEEKDENYLRRETSYGSFQRVVALPETADCDGADASFKNGVLNIEVPKKPEAIQKPRKLRIKKAA